MNFIILCLLISTFSYARWANKEDLSSIVLNSDTEIIVKKDGTHTIHDFTTYQILKDAGKEKFILFKIPFQSDSSTLKIIEASVTNGDKTIKVAPDKIVTLNIASDSGLTDSKEIQIAFPLLQINSKIVIKTFQTVHKVVVPGHYSLSGYLGYGEYVEKGFLKINSELPLNISKNDPFNSYDVQQTLEGKNHVYKVSLKTAFNRQLIDENGYLPKEKISQVDFSSSTDWVSIGQSLKVRFEAVLSSPFPKELEPVIGEAKLLPTDEAKVDHVLAYITKNYNYLGDWRTLNGGWSPKALTSILNTKYGDCKDFATLLTTMLRKLSINSEIALVHRSSPSYGNVLKTDSPKLDIFNHAIVRVKSGGGTFWVDPTNPQSYGLKHRADISGKKSFALAAPFVLEDIPLSPVADNTFVVEKTMSFLSEGNVSVSSKLKFNGDAALMFLGKESTIGKDRIQQTLLGLVSQGEGALLPELTPFDFQSRKYRDVNIDIKYTAKDAFQTNDKAKHALLPTMHLFLTGLRLNTHQSEGDIFIGSKSTLKRDVFMKGLFADKRPKGCFVDSKWVTLKRDFGFEKDGLRVKDEITFKENFVHQADFESTDIKVLVSSIGSCLQERTVEFKFGSTKHTDGIDSIAAKFDLLPAKDRVQKRFEYAVGISRDEILPKISDEDLMKLLSLNIQEDPKHVYSYHMLTRLVLISGYYNGHNYSPASIQTAQKILHEGLKQVPGHQGLMLLLLRTIVLAGDPAKAKNALPKVLAIRKLERLNDYMVLANLYKLLEMYKEATVTLQDGLKIAKSKWENKSLIFDLASTYSGFDAHKSVEAYEKLLKLDPTHNYAHTNLPSEYIKLGRFDDAVKVAREGYKAMPGGMMSHIAAYSLRSRADSYVKVKKFDLAEADFRESIQIQNHSDAYMGLAQVAFNKSDLVKLNSLVTEGAKYYEGPIESYYYDASYAFDVPSIQEPFLRLGLEHSSAPHMKLYGYRALSRSCFMLKKYAEFLKLAKEGIALGQAALKANPNDEEAKAGLTELISYAGPRMSDPVVKQTESKGAGREPAAAK